MNEIDLERLVMKLRSTTHLARLGHDEALILVAKIIEALAAPKTDA